MGTGWSSAKSKKSSNFGRLCKLLIDVGTRALRDVFNSINPPQSLQASVKEHKNYAILSNLKSKKVLFEEHLNKLYPSDGSAVSSSEFDIKLVWLLLLTICDLTEPKTGWDKLPMNDNFSTEADLIRIKLLGSKIYGRIPEREVSDSSFETYWAEFENVVERLCGGLYKAEIESLKLISVSSKDEKYYVQCLEEWKDFEEKLMKILEETNDKPRDDLESITNNASDDSSEIEITVEDAELYTENLKLSIRNQTGNLPKFNSTMMENMKTEEIFTNILITDNPKHCEDDPTVESKPTGFLLRKCKDIFSINNNGEHPKKIMIFAEQGKGKTFFCLKLVRDWSKDELFDEGSKQLGFHFVYFLTFRQLNLIDEDLNLRELFNFSSLLDSKSMTNDSIIEYFMHHSEQLLIIVDGVDEFMHRDKIGSDYEHGFPNDAKMKMPVAALCSKLIQSKILKNSTVMVTSRPDGNGEMMQRVHFDRYLEITEFNEQTSTSKRLYNAVQLW